jgi:predicted short-subunit dehydrogenase-like oxidoreductase (DUF2520 family)
MKMKVVVLGTGNVAWHLAPALEDAGHEVVAVYGRDLKAAESITSKLYIAEPKTDLDFAESDAELFILAVSDSALSDIANEIILPEESILVHTSGAEPLEILEYSSAAYTGIFYPLQTFTKGKAMDFGDVPILVESDDQTTLQQLKKVAKSLSSVSYTVKSKDRIALHVAAVFASNFSNHMIRLSEEIMIRQGLDFEMMKPLIIETISKSLELGAKKAQTGPAVRGDFQVMDRHYQFLNYNDQIAEIYKLISQDIIDSY